MICPYCGNDETKVIDKRDNQGITRRRRECMKCGMRFTTYERYEDNILVIKKDGSRQSFDQEKIFKGIIRSCEKRPISHEQISELVEKVVRDIRSLGVKEVKSTKIGTIVMRHLKKLDKVAYIRFASVYREFDDIEEFKKALDKL